MLVYACEKAKYGGPLEIAGDYYSFAPSGNVEGEYPIGISSTNRWLYGLASGQVRWYYPTGCLAPSMFVTGAKLEEVALNASLHV